MTHPLDDARVKLARATHHSKALGTEIQVWTTRQGERPPFEIRFEENDAVNQLIFLIGRVDPLPSMWSLIVGDAIFNYRSALDYAAWQMVAAGTNPNPGPKVEEGIAFPIQMHEARFPEMVRRRLPGIRPDHLAVVKRHQPYSLGPDAAKHPLQVLSNLSRHDKHRGIVIVSAKNLNYSGRIRRLVGWRPGPIVVPPKDAPMIIKAGTELLRISGEPIPPFPHLEVDMDFEGATQVAFETGTIVMNALEQFAEAVTTILSELTPLF